MRRGCAGGCLERVLALVVLAILLVAAWRFGPDVWERAVGVEEETSESEVEPSPELADLALERFRRTIAGEAETSSFSALELESLLRYRAADHLPQGVTEPTVEIRDGELRLGAQVSVELLPRIPELERVRELLPDRVPVELRGLLLTLEGVGPVFLVQRIAAAGVPIPRRLHEEVLEGVRTGEGRGLPPEAIRLPLPVGIRTLRVQDGELIIQGAD